MSAISPGEAQRPGRPPLLGGIEALFSAYAKALDDEDAAEGRAIDMLVTRLRHKTDAALIRTERGTGYVLTTEVTPDDA